MVDGSRHDTPGCMTTETELKLALEPRALERLRRHPVVRELKRGRGVTRTMTSVYFDTPDHRLHHAGASLRIRHVGRRRIQTLKSADGTGGGHMSRTEWEQEIATERPDAAVLRAADLALLKRAEVIDRLKPVFTTQVRRTTYRLGNGVWEAELALDHGAVEVGGRSEPLCEAELELKQGRPAHLFDLARRLMEDIPLRVTVGSKADRGYALATGERPRPVKAEPIPLTPGMTSADAFRAIGRACLRHLLVNEALLRGERHPESVHQMRVAMRRLRSALSVFGPMVATPGAEAVKAELKWLTGELGPARDLDVFLAEILGPVHAAYSDEPGMERLIAAFEHRRAAAYERALSAVETLRFTRMVLDVAAWIEDGDWRDPSGHGTVDAPGILARPIEGLAADILEARRAKVRKRGRHFAKLDAERRHRVRIQVKKLRYAVEFFQSLFGKKKTKTFTRALTALQGHLGRLNDIAVAHAMLRDLVADGEPPPRGKAARQRAFAAGLVTGWHAAQADDVLDAAKQAWKAFAKSKPFWD